MSKTQTIQINFTGGIVSPGALKDVLQLAAQALIRQVRFGLRQQLLLDVPISGINHFLKECKARNLSCAPQKLATPNIVSSYPATGIFTSDTWMREGVYKDVFNQFNFSPSLKLNICDSTQNLVPFFTGHINWITSPSPHFWYLYIRFPKTQNIFCWPELIYTNDIAAVSKRVETALKENQHTHNQHPDLAGSQLFTTVKAMGHYSGKTPGAALALPRFSLPYYEGFNQSETGLWLGLYRRDEAFPVAFLQDVCSICMESKIGQLYTTPWKSLIVKSINKKHTERWDWVLGKYRINVRHAANELAWQVEDGDESGLLIKRHLIRHFDKEDVRTFGLSFGVQSRPTSSMFGSIIIRKQQNKNPHKLKSLERFDLLHTRNFNPNSSDLVLFREGLEKDQIGTYLVSLCKLYYQQQEERLNASHRSAASNQVQPAPAAKISQVYQCSHCLSVYDEQHGDAEQNIPAGTSFIALPQTFVCSTCEAEKTAFTATDRVSLHIQE